MKIKLLLSICVLFFIGLCTIPVYAQTQMISITNVKYADGTSLPSGSSIRIIDGIETTISFDLGINNPQMAFAKGGILSVQSKFSSNSTLEHVRFVFGINAITGSISKKCTINLRASHFPTGTGAIYAQFSPNDGPPVSGTSVPVKVYSPISNNTISGNQTIFEGDPVSSINGSTPRGGDGNYTYTWQRSINGGVWSTISGATGTSYQQTSNSVSTIYYRRIITSLSGLLTSTSNEVTVSILPNIPIQNNTITLAGSNIQGSIPTGGTGSFTYKWYANLVDGEDWALLPGTGKDLSIPDYVYGFAEGQGHELFIYREVKSGSKISNSTVVRILPAQPIENNTIAIEGLNIIGSLPTGGNGDFRYEYYSYLEFPDGEIEGPSMIGSTQHYMVGATPPPVIKYYRRVVSANKSSISNVVSFPLAKSFSNKESLSGNSISDLTVYPNPTSESINFATNFSTDKNIEIVLYSEKLGNEKSVYKGKVTPNQVVNWDIPANYQKGLYFYKILSDNKEVKTGKVIFQ